MNFAITDIYQAWNQLTSTMSAGRVTGVNTIDHAFITPTIIGKLFDVFFIVAHIVNNFLISYCNQIRFTAIGDIPDNKVDDLKQIIQGDPAVIWNLG